MTPTRRISNVPYACMVAFLAVVLSGCGSSGDSAIESQTYCMELDAGYGRFTTATHAAGESLKILEADEKKALDSAAPIADDEEIKRATVCARATWDMAGGLQYLVGVDRSAHIFFGLGKDERHAKAGLVHSEISNAPDDIFDPDAFFRACRDRNAEAGGVRAIESAKARAVELVKPYYALCRELGATMHGDK